LAQRTRYIVLGMENIYQSHNASACYRTCEILGIQEVHVIENASKWKNSRRISSGAHNWIDIHQHALHDDNTDEALLALKARGYRLLATAPDPNARPLFDVDIHEGPFVLLVGSETSGLSPRARALADDCVSLPMYGFTESYNVSVATALALSHLRRALQHSDLPWQLSEAEAVDLRIKWLRHSIRASERLEKRFLEAREME
ncbi:MAG: RNA methyltransferase, partial [Bacteroidota bacterium]